MAELKPKQAQEKAKEPTKGYVDKLAEKGNGATPATASTEDLSDGVVGAALAYIDAVRTCDPEQLRLLQELAEAVDALEEAEMGDDW